jgi:hypothetical protein
MAVETIFLSNAFDDEHDALADTDTHRAQRETAIAAVTSRAPDMPSGWPSAIAPPFGLMRASSSAMPSWRSTANSWLANASLSSITSIWPSVMPSCAISFCVAGAGPMPMMRGATPAVAMPTIRARGFRPCLSAACALASNTAQAPSLTLLALPAVTLPSGRTYEALELCQGFQRAGTRLLVLVDTQRFAFFLRDFHRGNFGSERAVGLSASGLFLAAQGKRVLIGAADIEFDRDILGGFRAIPYVRRLGYLKAFATNCIFQVVNSTLRAAILPLLQTCDL